MKKMHKKWLSLTAKLIDNFDNMRELECPNCKAHEIDYLYIINEHDRIGYIHIWCSNCLTGIYISRARAPLNAKTILFGQVDELKKLVPEYKIIT